MSDRFRLRPVTEEDLDHLEAMVSDPEAIGEFNWGGWQDPRFWRRRWEENRLLGGERWTMIAEAPAGERIGFISWQPVHSGSPYECWEVGISLWPQWRGQGFGTEMQREVALYLFTHTTLNRVQAVTASDNIAEQRALEKAGFTREGVLRGQAFRDGAWRDEVIYGVIRSDVMP